MGDDTYSRYFPTGDRAFAVGGVSRTSFPAYSDAPPLTSYSTSTSNAPPLTSYSTSTSIDPWGILPEYLQQDIKSSQPGEYGYTEMGGVRNYPEPVIGGVTSSVSAKGYTSPLEDSLVSQRREMSVRNSSGLLGVNDIGHERARNAEGIPVPAESNILFVEGLPTDCTRREIGDKAMVLCFVEFVEAKCARTAMEALQGYKFDDKKPDSPALKIQFAQFPLRISSIYDKR